MALSDSKNNLCFKFQVCLSFSPMQVDCFIANFASDSTKIFDFLYFWRGEKSLETGLRLLPIQYLNHESIAEFVRVPSAVVQSFKVLDN